MINPITVSAKQKVQFFYNLQTSTKVDIIQEQLDTVLLDGITLHILLHPETKYNFQTLQLLDYYYQEKGVHFAISKTSTTVEQLLFIPPKISRFPFEFIVDLENEIVYPSRDENQVIMRLSDDLSESIRLQSQEEATINYVVIEPEAFNRSVVQLWQKQAEPLVKETTTFKYFQPVSRYEAVENIAWSIITIFTVGIIVFTILILIARMLTATKFGGENDNY